MKKRRTYGFLNLLVFVVSSHCFGQTITPITPTTFFSSKGVLKYDDNCRKSNAHPLVLLDSNNSKYATLNMKNGSVFIHKSKKLYRLSESSETGWIRKNVLKIKEFYPDYSIIQFEVLRIDSGFYWVYVDKSKNVVKKVTVSSCWIYQDWNKHFIGSMLEFDPISNPIRQAPDDSSKMLGYKEEYDQTFIIREMRGEWIRIECSGICGSPCDKRMRDGWIRWVRKGKLVIGLRYIC